MPGLKKKKEKDPEDPLLPDCFSLDNSIYFIWHSCAILFCPAGG